MLYMTDEEFIGASRAGTNADDSDALRRRMPELPEVEFCRRALLRWTEGGEVARIDVLDARSVRDRRADRPSAGSAAAAERLGRVMRGRTLGIDRLGKRLLWRFERGAVLVHLGMTGRWTREAARFGKVRVWVGDTALTFNDPRLLGGLVPFENAATAHEALAEGLGPDAMGPLPALGGVRAVKLALMDQRVVAGIGNVQAMEALWRAGIHPARPAFSVVGAEHTRLESAVHTQLRETLRVLGDGDEIQYVEEPGGLNPFPLYQRTGEPCPACHTPIAHFRQAGRGTWWCPACQRQEAK